jgi:hypothetical protein
MEKYYTPKSDEFNTSFLWQLRDNDKWVNLLGYPTDLINLLNDDKIRVKYLDQEDIESLGFNYISENEYTTHLAGDGYVLNIFLDNNILISYGTIHDSDTIFRGIIKNKSELKRLLKQLNIK